ncbi:hypothetical protein PRZ48_014230 [Zasmidium cellare]|uniref:Uncharacterized protein n=1 Tax=Zasmidium cellare TaxID=395010 RepID=A0ABR0E0D9_ZASCE|nr:hypothetical protein PRZ48_014230 [Zasmidium cellare]
MSPAKKPFRLLDLATELQDLIDEIYFSSNLVFVVSEASPNPPYLEVLRTRNDQEKYESAKATCYKHATFKVREEHLKAFLDNAKPHTRHIKEIRVDSQASFDRGVTIDKYVKPKGPPKSPHDERATYFLMYADATASAYLSNYYLKRLEEALRTTDLKPGTLKKVVKVMDGKKIIWEKWASDCDAAISMAISYAGYP